jgi:uncharacterized protein (TIGR02246 family)
MTDDLRDVLAANDAFYRAFAALDADAMAAVWLPADDVFCVHPGQGALVGFAAVQASWARIFDGTVAMRFTQRQVHVERHGDVAWVLLVEDIESLHAEGPGRGLVQATNVFRRVDGRWWLVHHHGSPLLHASPEPTLQ